MANTEADKETVRRIREYLKEKEAIKLPPIPKEKEVEKKRKGK